MHSGAQHALLRCAEKGSKPDAQQESAVSKRLKITSTGFVRSGRLAHHLVGKAEGPGAPGAHHEGGTRMGSDPKTSVVNRYGQSWDVPNLFVVSSSTFSSMSGFNPSIPSTCRVARSAPPR